MIKTIKKHKAAFVLFFALLLVFPGVAAVTWADAPDGLEVTNDTVTGYYMHIPLSQIGVAYSFADIQNRPSGTTFSRGNREVTLIVVFPDVTYEGRNLLATTYTVLNCPPGWSSLNGRYEFTEDVRINIRESYYNYFQAKGGYEKIQLTMLYKGKGCMLYGDKWDQVKSFTLPIIFETKELDPGVNDPDDPNFELGDNGGTGTNIVNGDKEGFNLWQFIAKCFQSVFDGTAGFKEWVTVIMTIMAGLLVLGLLIAFFRLLARLFKGGK